MNRYVIYTDGGARNTGNKKGQHLKRKDKSAYAYLITLNNKKVAVGTAGYYGQTNNKMEMLAVIKALLGVIKLSQAPFVKDKKQPHRYTLAGPDLDLDSFKIISDSKYVDDAINQSWLSQWQSKHYYKRKNACLWSVLATLLSMFNHISFHWTKGHASGKTTASKGNIFVDHTLNKTMDKMKNKH